jgi:hypothetical protein
MALYHLYRHDAYQYGVWLGQSAARSIRGRLDNNKSLTLNDVLREDIFYLEYPEAIVYDDERAEFFKGFTMSYVELVVDLFGYHVRFPDWTWFESERKAHVSA